MFEAAIGVWCSPQGCVHKQIFTIDISRSRMYTPLGRAPSEILLGFSFAYSDSALWSQIDQEQNGLF